MAGYSGTPLMNKLGIGEGARVAFLNAPAGFAEILGALPPGAEAVGGHDEPLDVAVLFVTERAVLGAAFAALTARMTPSGGLWVAWPKRASGVPSDLNESVAREIGLAAGLVDNKVCAINDTWSGLRFVYRLQDRPAVAARLAVRQDGGR